MSLVDDDQHRIASLLIPLDPLLDRLVSIQHDHLSDIEVITIETQRAVRAMQKTIASLPPWRHAHYSRVYVDLLWAAAVRLNSLAHTEREWHDERAACG